MLLVYALLASFIVSLLSFVGAISLVLKKETLGKVIFIMISFAAGSLIGGAFLHLLPEALEHSRPDSIFVYTLIGFCAFFILERVLLWRHCHEGHCEIHPVTYLTLFSDGVHNFMDGVVIGGSFAVDFNIGVVATLIIIMHEIPHELGNFGILLFGGMTS